MRVLPGLLALAAAAVAIPLTGGDKDFAVSVRNVGTGAHLCDATVGVSERIAHSDHDIALVRLSVPVSMNCGIPADADAYRDWITRHLAEEL